MVRVLVRCIRTAVYLGLAWARRGPGIGMHIRIAKLGASLAARHRAPKRDVAPLIVAPLDSVRYFELSWAWNITKPRHAVPTKYLDVGSPRALPVTLLLRGTT